MEYLIISILISLSLISNYYYLKCEFKYIYDRSINDNKLDVLDYAFECFLFIWEFILSICPIVDIFTAFYWYGKNKNLFK